MCSCSIPVLAQEWNLGCRSSNVDLCALSVDDLQARYCMHTIMLGQLLSN